jgi:hypothetical protein
VSSTVSVKDRSLSSHLIETLQLTVCSSKPKTLVILSCERPTAHWEWRDGESSMYPHGQGLDWRCTVLLGGIGSSYVLEDPGEG